MLPPQVQQLIAQQSNSNDPEDVIRTQQQQIQQMQQQLQIQTQHLQQMADELEKANTGNEIKVLDIQTKRDIADDKIKADFAKQEAQHDQEKRLLEIEGQIKLLLNALDANNKGQLQNLQSLNRVSEKIEGLSPV